MKTYDEVTEHILTTARSRRRRSRQIQYAASVSVICAVCIMGLGVYMKLEKPVTAPIQKETFTSAVSESSSGAPGEFPETITAEQPVPPEESGSMTDLTEPPVSGDISSIVPGLAETALPPESSLPQTDPPEDEAATAASSNDPAEEPGTEAPAETDLPAITDSPIPEDSDPPTEATPGTDSPSRPMTEAPSGGESSSHPVTEAPSGGESPSYPVTESPFPSTESPNGSPNLSETQTDVNPGGSPPEETTTTTPPPPYADLLAQLPPFDPSGKMELTDYQIYLLLKLRKLGALPDYWVEYVEIYILKLK